MDHHVDLDDTQPNKNPYNNHYTLHSLSTTHSPLATLFNLSRYIRLTYTALALTLPTIATTLTAASTVSLLTNTKQPLSK